MTAPLGKPHLPTNPVVRPTNWSGWEVLLAHHDQSHDWHSQAWLEFWSYYCLPGSHPPIQEGIPNKKYSRHSLYQSMYLWEIGEHNDLIEDTQATNCQKNWHFSIRRQSNMCRRYFSKLSSRASFVRRWDGSPASKKEAPSSWPPQIREIVGDVLVLKHLPPMTPLVEALRHYD